MHRNRMALLRGMERLKISYALKVDLYISKVFFRGLVITT